MDTSAYTTTSDPVQTDHLGETKTQEMTRRADHYLRENPIPAVIGAIAIGLAIGLLVRASQPRRSRWEQAGNDMEGYWDSVIPPLTKRAKKAYGRSSHAIHDAVEAVRDVDVDDYIDPVASWFQRLWRKAV